MAHAVEIAKPTAKVYPGVRATSLILMSPEGRERTRLGGGIVIHSIFRHYTLEVDIFEKKYDAAGDDRSTSVIATMGGAAYSDFLGGGKRRNLNPYIGLRMGYAYLDTHRFAVQAEAGLELFKSKYVVLDTSLRATNLFGKQYDLAMVAGAGASVAF